MTSGTYIRRKVIRALKERDCAFITIRRAAKVYDGDHIVISYLDPTNTQRSYTYSVRGKTLDTGDFLGNFDRYLASKYKERRR